MARLFKTTLASPSPPTVLNDSREESLHSFARTELGRQKSIRIASNLPPVPPDLIQATKAARRQTITLETLVSNFVSSHVKNYCFDQAKRFVEELKFPGEASPTVSSASSATPGAEQTPDSGKDMNSPFSREGLPTLKPSADTGFAAVVMADVSGYSKLSARLAERGPHGAELLGKAMKGYLDQIINIILMHGGDIVKFAGTPKSILTTGDAVIFYWKLKKLSQEEEEDFLEGTATRQQINEMECAKGEIVLKAANCCLDLLKKLGTYDIDLPDCDIKVLRIHLGIGAGQIYDVHVGHGDRWEHFIAGDAVNQLAVVLDLAKSGELAMSHQGLKYFSTVIDIASVTIGNYDKRCIILTGLENAQRKDQKAPNGPTKIYFEVPKRFSLLSETPFDGSSDVDRFERIKYVSSELSKRFVNQSALFKLQMDLNQSKVFRIESGVEELMALNELRQVTTVFMKIGSLVTTDPKHMLETAQDVISIVESACKRYEGSMRQFHVDDKGAVILIFFGLPPLAHANDAIYGIKAALEIKERFEKLFDNFSMGITTGAISIGAVGNAVRTEYALMGDSINMAARLMCQPAAKSNILCDEKTFKLCETDFVFEDLGQAKVKGKDKPIAIFQPKSIKNSKTEDNKSVEDTVRVIGRDKEKAAITRVLESHKAHGDDRLLLFEADGGQGLSTLADLSKREALQSGYSVLTAAGNELDRRNQYFVVKQLVMDMLCINGHRHLEDNGSGIHKESARQAKNISRIGSDEMQSQSSPTTSNGKLNSPTITFKSKAQHNRFSSINKKKHASTDALSTRIGASVSPIDASSKAPLNRLSGLGIRKGGHEPLTLEERFMDIFITLREDPQNIPLLNLIFPGQFMENEYTSSIQGKMRSREFTRMMCRMINQKTNQEPVVLIIQEAQWIDVASWEFFWEIFTSCPEMLIFSFSRPLTHFDNEETCQIYQRFKKAPTVKLFVLEGLTKKYTEEMVIYHWLKLNKESKAMKVSNVLLEHIQRKTNGSPLYIGSLVYTLNESGACMVDDKGVLNLVKSDFDFDQKIVMGDGLSSIIISQLDRIDREFQLFLKVASVLGQRFCLSDVMFFLSDTPGILEKFCYDEEDVEPCLLQIKSLDKYGYLSKVDSNEGDEMMLSFKSDIVRKCIYSTMVVSQRQQLHLYVASYYEKMLNETNRNRLLVQVYEHFANTDQRQVLKKLKYLESVAHFYYEENLMLEAIKHYNLLIEQSDEAQRSTFVVLHHNDTKAAWHLELGDAYYARGELKSCEEHLRKAIHLVGFGFPSSETLIKMLVWKHFLVRGPSNWDLRNKRESTARLQAILKEISENPNSNLMDGKNEADDIIGKNLIVTHFQKSLAMNSTSALGTQRFSDCELKVLLQDKKLNQLHIVRKALMVIAQVFFQQGRHYSHNYAVLMALKFSDKFPPDSFYGRLLSMQGHVTWLMQQEEGDTLQDILMGLRLDRKDNLAHTIRIIHNTAIALFWMGHWQASIKYLSSLDDLAQISSTFSYKMEALRLKSFIVYLTGLRVHSMGLAKELYNQSLSNNDVEGKVCGYQLILANLISMPGTKREIKEATEMLKNLWAQCEKVQNDPYIKFIQFALVRMAEHKLGSSLSVGEYLKELEAHTDALLARVNVFKGSDNPDNHLGVGRHWVLLLGFLTAASMLFSFIDNGGSLTADDRREIVVVAGKIKKFIKTSDIRFFLVSKSVRFVFKGIKHIFDKNAPLVSIRSWQRGLVSGAPCEFVVGILNARIAKHSQKESRNRYLAEATRIFKQIGSMTELEVLKSI